MDHDACMYSMPKKQSENLTSGETGKSCIIPLAKQTERCNIQAARICKLTILEWGIIKYHASNATEILRGIW